ncbi:MAG: phosphate acyltransferase PlsX [Armatimonadetes bacterium]|nr:phosphate acyltransferase PlsX [Armatimonadota bacterium]
MRIAVDAMGGDRAPDEIVAGALDSCEEPGHELILVGQPDAIRACTAGRKFPAERVEVRPAAGVVGMGESPASSLKRRETSIAVAVQLVRDGEAQAVVSAGNSGAFMAHATLRLATIEGVERPAIAIVVPALAGPRVLLDAGANASCRPEHLVQFAHMGAVYARDVLAIPNPRVALMSIGEEASKGSGLTKAAHRMLSDLGEGLNFVGNVEGDTVFADVADVVVCDGFTGNVFLKTAEGTAEALMEGLRAAITSSLRAKLGAFLIRGALGKFRRLFDYATYGGALLLGVNGICVVGHGRSDARAVKAAISVAKRAVETRVVEEIAASCRAIEAPTRLPESAGAAVGAGAPTGGG